MIIYLLIALVDFGFFWKLNSKFTQTYHQYTGKYLWTLLFFPLFYFVNLIFFELAALFASFSFSVLAVQKGTDPTLMSLCNIIRNWSIVFFFLFGAGIYFVYKSRVGLNKILFNWGNNKENEALKLISIILGIGIILPSLYFISIYVNISNNQWLWWYLNANFGEGILAGAASSGFIGLFINAAIGCLIWYLAKKKLSTLSENLGIREESHIEETFIKAPISEQNDSSRSSINELKDLKQLFDDGVLSEEEFIRMKKEILNAGI